MAQKNSKLSIWSTLLKSSIFRFIPSRFIKLIALLLILAAFALGYYIGKQRQPQYVKIDVKRILQEERDYLAQNNPDIDIIDWTVKLRAEFDEVVKPYEKQYLVIFTELPIIGAKDITSEVQSQLQKKVER